MFFKSTKPSLPPSMLEANVSSFWRGVSADAGLYAYVFDDRDYSFGWSIITDQPMYGIILDGSTRLTATSYCANNYAVFKEKDPVNPSDCWTLYMDSSSHAILAHGYPIGHEMKDILSDYMDEDEEWHSVHIGDGWYEGAFPASIDDEETLVGKGTYEGSADKTIACSWPRWQKPTGGFGQYILPFGDNYQGRDGKSGTKTIGVPKWSNSSAGDIYRTMKDISGHYSYIVDGGSIGLSSLEWNYGINGLYGRGADGFFLSSDSEPVPRSTFNAKLCRDEDGHIVVEDIAIAHANWAGEIPRTYSDQYPSLMSSYYAIDLGVM